MSISGRSSQPRNTYLDSNERIESADRELERLEEAILVREHTELARRDTKADAGMYVLGRRLEPSIPLGLSIKVRRAKKVDGSWVRRTCLKMWWRRAS